MPSEARGPRLWFKRGNRRADGSRADGTWTIKDDRGIRVSTGVRAPRRGKPPQAAQDALAEYIIGRRAIPRERNSAADAVKVADVIAIYMQDRAPKHARPIETIARCERLYEWWGTKRLSDVNGRECRAYVAARDGRAAARRELEDLRAAIGHYRREGLCREVVDVTLPERGLPRDRWLTRSEAARLIWAAWRYREVQKGHATGRRSRRHVARFVLVALYTGTRAGAVCSAVLGPATHAGWIDLERGVFHRRAVSERETKKRKPPVRLALRLFGHLRRWHANGQRHAVEFNGRPIGTGLEKAFRRACQDAGLEGVTPHTLRHTAATWLMQRGVPLQEAADFLGMSIETLQRIYYHAHPDFQRNAAEAITRKPQAVDQPWTVSR
jgi:integrase